MYTLKPSTRTGETGGVTVIDYRNPRKPQEIAFYRPEPTDDPVAAEPNGHWSAYFYNGFIYGNDLDRGFDVFEYTGGRPVGPEVAQHHRRDAARRGVPAGAPRMPRDGGGVAYVVCHFAALRHCAAPGMAVRGSPRAMSRKTSSSVARP
jgi:hypothetical protein